MQISICCVFCKDASSTRVTREHAYYSLLRLTVHSGTLNTYQCNQQDIKDSYFYVSLNFSETVVAFDKMYALKSLGR